MFGVIALLVACVPPPRPGTPPKEPPADPSHARALEAGYDVGYRGWTRTDGEHAGPAVGARLRAEQRLATAWAAGALVSTNGAVQLLDGQLGATLATPAWRRLHADVTAAVDRDAYTSDVRRTELGARARIWLGTARTGVWGAVGRSRPWQGGLTPDGVERSAGGWATVGPLRLETAVRTRATSTYTFVGQDSSGIDPTTCRATNTPQHYSLCRGHNRSTDAEGRVGWQAGAATFAVGGGVRVATRLAARGASSARPTWLAARAGVPLSRRLALDADVARLPPDVVRLFPARTMFSLGLRVRPVGGVRRDPTPRLGTDGGDRSVETVAVSAPDGAGMRSLTLTVAAASRVELRGDCTAWAPVLLHADGLGRWSVRFALPPGVYHVMLRVDGGVWRAPRGVPTADDGFGDEVGVLAVD